MHTRRLVAFLLGVWLGGILFVAYITNANTSTTRNILENPPEGPRRLMEISGIERVNTLLNYNTAEVNRELTESWEWFQLAIGLALVLTLPFAMRLKWLYLVAAVLMFLISIGQRFLLTPQMTGLGRILDMAGGTLWTQDEWWKVRRSVRTLQELYTACEIVKVLIGTGLTLALLIFRRKAAFKSRAERRTSSSEKIDTVDDSDYSHVDR
jgi:hypothetical protein